jgi:hypothetical protein
MITIPSAIATYGIASMAEYDSMYVYADNYNRTQ